jgi:hypothetical protein
LKRIVTVCCLVLLANVGIAYAQNAKPRGYDLLSTRLASVKSLSNHDPGFGDSNEFYKLSQEFLKHHNQSDFKLMLFSRNPIVKAMGLLCLAQVDFDKYWLTLLSHWKDNEEVYLHRGCFVSKVTIGEFAQRMLNNPYFLDPLEKRPEM